MVKLDARRIEIRPTGPPCHWRITSVCLPRPRVHSWLVALLHHAPATMSYRRTNPKNNKGAAQPTIRNPNAIRPIRIVIWIARGSGLKQVKDISRAKRVAALGLRRQRALLSHPCGPDLSPTRLMWPDRRENPKQARLRRPAGRFLLLNYSSAAR
jgi:hypothetical protein